MAALLLFADEGGRGWITFVVALLFFGLPAVRAWLEQRKRRADAQGGAQDASAPSAGEALEDEEQGRAAWEALLRGEALEPARPAPSEPPPPVPVARRAQAGLPMPVESEAEPRPLETLQRAPPALPEIESEDEEEERGASARGLETELPAPRVALPSSAMGPGLSSDQIAGTDRRAASLFSDRERAVPAMGFEAIDELAPLRPAELRRAMLWSLVLGPPRALEPDPLGLEAGR